MGQSSCTSTHLTKLATMKIVTLRVPDEMASLIQEWAKFIPGMEIVSAEEVVEHCGRDLDEVRLARAIESCMPWFWGNSAYAVVYCVCRDVLDIKLSKAGFEKMIEGLPYTRCRTYVCRPGTVANAFRNNPVFAENIRDWDKFNVLPRIRKLRDELVNSL